MRAVNSMRWLLHLGFVALCAPAWAAMSVAEQNALVKTYCAVCHTDKAGNGGLSLEHFDAARRDPALAAMILSKLNNGAMGAAGNGVPDKALQQAWLDSTREQAKGADQWFVSRDRNVVSASIVRAVPPRAPGTTDAPVYRLRILCDSTAHSGEMQLTWSPQPQTGRTMTVAGDDREPVNYRLDGTESMGNGATVKSGHASVVLSSGAAAGLALPNRLLIVRDLFPGETVKFPFEDLGQKARSDLSACFQADAAVGNRAAGEERH